MKNTVEKLTEVPHVAEPIPRDLESATFLKISEISEKFGVTLRALRFYEEKGLLCPMRKGARRYFRAREVARMRIILQARRIGLTIGEIKKVIEIAESGLSASERCRKLHTICTKHEAELREREAMIHSQVAETRQILAHLQSTAFEVV
ncbi:MerR family transcriptional regulator [Stappia sp. F7233]|uniref:MerR family transcriptional regulator n=1 Tax=Stappia albiluteola TaxID=2758565 RepID=A0A839AEU5_9HYPH|nr:MerR family transcriptional regulator [Stappia albiluteola]MBA5777099.1 MerR family transcriptional regulator [Stappia albiluteola]